jgi:peptidoglycan/LPS O-acetylase OafA/YrhL
MRSNTQQERAYSLDAIRFVASVIMMCGHYGVGTFFSPTLNDLFLSGAMTVIFFSMSGFVIASSESFYSGSALLLAKKRTLRLLLPHWVGLALVLIPSVSGTYRISWSELGHILSYWVPGLQNLAAPGVFTFKWNFPAWFVTPILLGGLMLPCIKWLRVRSWPSLVSLAVCIGLVVLRAMIDPYYASPGSTKNQFFANFPRFLEIFAGAFLGAALMGKENRLIKLLRTDMPLLTTVGLAATLLLGIRLEFGSDAMHNFTRVFFLPFALWIVATGYFNRGWCYRLASHSIIVFFARISILIWLLHVPIRNLMLIVGARLGLPYGPLILALTVAVVFTTAALLEPILAYVYRALIQFPGSSARPSPETPAPVAP